MSSTHEVIRAILTTTRLQTTSKFQHAASAGYGDDSRPGDLVIRRNLMIAIASIVLSAIAIAFSIFAFAEGRQRYKRDVFLKIHELMISEDQYRGRQLLLSHDFDDVSIEKLTLEDRANISRAIATYDTLGLYLRRGYLIEKDVIEMWGTAACRAWRKAQPFVERRAKTTGLPAYPNFQYLAGLAADLVGPADPPSQDRRAS